MERSKVIVWVLVGLAAIVIIWWVGFHDSPSSPPAAETPAQTKVVATSDSAAPKAEAGAKDKAATAPDAGRPNEAAKAASPEPNKPGPDKPAQAVEPNAPGSRPVAARPPQTGEPNAPRPAGKPVAAKPAEVKPGESKPPATKPGQPKIKEDPNDPLEAVNLKDVEMKSIIEKIAQWTGKTVIPSDQAMTQKITIYAPDKLPRSKALLKIYSALRMKGFMPELVEDTIFLKPLAEAKLGTYPIVGPEQTLAAFENVTQVVQKFFKLEHYSPAQMGQIVQPLIGEYGHVSADESTGRLLVIDTVGNLRKIEQIIAQFDVADAGRAVSEIFEIKYGDPVEIHQFLRMLFGESADGRRGGPMRSQFSRMSKPGGGPSGGPSGPGGPPGSQSKTATSVVIGAGEVPLFMFPEPKHKWIIARGSAEDIKLIGEWIKKLDTAGPVQSECETISIIYADTREVASRLEQSLQQTTGTDLRPNIVIQPLEQSRQIMIWGRPDVRAMVKKIIAGIDMPTGQFVSEDFELQYADPDQIKTNIEGLYENQSGSMYSFGYRTSRFRNVQPGETVKVVSYPTMGKVTVIASAENMEKIRKQIKEWDVPLDIDKVKPRIIELKNSDPVKMAQLLTKLFSEAADDSSRNFMRLIFFGDESEQKKKIVGPLYGQFTFEEVPGTKKIIVISKIPEAYDIIEQLILDLDRQEMAEVPKVVQLKYADPEDLAERLNAMFNEPGTRAPIRRTPSGLGNYSMEQPTSGGGQSGGPSGGGGPGGGNNQGTNPGEYVPWWSVGARRTLDEAPLSNVIGRVRFIPDPHSKALLILSPPEYHNDIEKMIRSLDVPGLQVMIKATVLEVDHSALTSLGLQLATNPATFDTSQGNSVIAANALAALSRSGSTILGNPLSPPSGGTGQIAGAQASIYALIDFLVKHVNAKILNEQTLWTEDNEEASFFKGEKVAFLGGSTVVTGGLAQQNVMFEKVGMTLAVRPSITPEKNVDMIVNILMSQLTSDLVNLQPVRTQMETKTNMIVKDSETLMLGGILFQEKSQVKHKIPLLGDLPLVGWLFQHNNLKVSNNEVIVFITPFVISDGTMSEEAQAALQKSKEHLDQSKQELNDAAEQLQRQLDKE